MSESYQFIVDTEDYSGNFERELCAYVTGQIGECEVGEKLADLAKTELPVHVAQWFELYTERPGDEHGCHRPCSISITPGWYNTGMGKHKKGKGKYPAYLSVEIYFSKRPPDDILRLMVPRVKFFCENFPTLSRLRPADPIKYTGCRLVKVTVTTTQEPLDIPT